jgi:GTP-binding protein LepA
MVSMNYLGPERVELDYQLPLGRDRVRLLRPAQVADPKGYASLDYEPAGLPGRRPRQGRHPPQRPAGRRLLAIVHRSKATTTGRRWSAKLRELIPRQLFDVPIQAAIGGRIIARETVKAKRKDVLAKCYGGDVSAARRSSSSARRRARSG